MLSAAEGSGDEGPVPAVFSMTLTHICHTGNDDNDDDTPLIPA